MRVPRVTTTTTGPPTGSIPIPEPASFVLPVPALAGGRTAGRRAEQDREFTAFMADSAPALARTAWLLCGDVHQADELVQQALVRTYLA